MSNFSHGQAAENAAAEYLEKRGYVILARNWSTRWCEIDIVAKKKKVVYFVEVKYRVTDNQGSGIDYITPRKLNQMKFAAELWVAQNNWSGDYQLAAIEVTGLNFTIATFLESV